jgi:hypothetical protein
MALNASALAQLMVDKTKSIPGIKIDNESELMASKMAMAEAIVEHIQAAGVVTVDLSGNSAGGDSVVPPTAQGTIS